MLLSVDRLRTGTGLLCGTLRYVGPCVQLCVGLCVGLCMYRAVYMAVRGAVLMAVCRTICLAASRDGWRAVVVWF